MNESDIEVIEIPIDSTTTLFKRVHHYASGDLVEYEIRQAHLDINGDLLYFHPVRFGTEVAQIIAGHLARLASGS